jgi:CDP-diacylglycerol--glycerol-3-phosphate 3-phosphatidyltransferase
LIALALAGLTPAWIPLVIIGREFLVSGLRSYAASCDRIISAHIWGKGKAASTMVAVGLLLLAEDGRAHGLLAASLSHSAWQNAFNICLWLLGLSAVLTVISGIRYFVDAWPLFRPGPVPVEARDAPRPRRAAGMDR